jgi:hypothetical protein
MGTMGIFSAALGMSCEDGHRSGDSSWANYAADSPRKQMARSMVVMMATINKTHFGGRQASADDVLNKYIAAVGGAA